MNNGKVNPLLLGVIFFAGFMFMQMRDGKIEVADIIAGAVISLVVYFGVSFIAKRK